MVEHGNILMVIYSAMGIVRSKLRESLYLLDPFFAYQYSLILTTERPKGTVTFQRKTIWQTSMPFFRYSPVSELAPARNNIPVRFFFAIL